MLVLEPDFMKNKKCYIYNEEKNEYIPTESATQKEIEEIKWYNSLKNYDGGIYADETPEEIMEKVNKELKRLENLQIDDDGFVPEDYCEIDPNDPDLDENFDEEAFEKEYEKGYQEWLKQHPEEQKKSKN